jgi:Tfp pilus assembly protein PilF
VYADEDEPTSRMDLEALFQAERTKQPPPVEQTPLVSVQGPPAPQAVPAPATHSRYAKIGVGLFVLGVLVGVGGAAAVMASRAPAAPGAAAGSSVSTLAASAPRPAPALATGAPPSPAIETPARVPAAAANAAKPVDAPATQKSVAPAEAPAPTALPISSSRAPSCQQLLGEPPVKRQSAKAAGRETLLANRQLVLGNVAMAHAAYCNAFALDRSNVDRHVNLARLYLVRRDWEKAAELAQSGLKLDPDNRRALGVLGDASAALNKSDAALAAMLAAEGKPRATERELRLIVKRNLALAQRVARMSDFLLAERLYRRVLLIDPHEAEAMSGIARCLLKAGDTKAAEAWARQAKQLKGSVER